MIGGALFIAVFLACVVEAVEALTIVLAAGTSRDWRSAITGVVAGVGVLALIVAVLGPAVTAIPLAGLRLVVGGLLLIFGLQWLRKAILRAGGLKALHDEDAIYAAELAAAQAAPGRRRGAVADWYSFTLSFKVWCSRASRSCSSRSRSGPTSTTSPWPRSRRWPRCWWSPSPGSRCARRWPGYRRTP